MHTREQLIEMLVRHKEWQGKINFYKMEIKSLTNELDEFVKSNNRDDIDFVQVEHFQNQFICQLEVLDVMRHDFKQHENKIEENAKNPLQNLAEAHLEEKEKLTRFEKVYRELRESFHSFLHKEFIP
jgi:hypothetical protein